jgi:hypothetical protein
MVMAALQRMQHAQQNEGMGPALMCCCYLLGQEYANAEHQLFIKNMIAIG